MSAKSGCGCFLPRNCKDLQWYNRNHFFTFRLFVTLATDNKASLGHRSHSPCGGTMP
jgi:hypothetical protein